MCRCPKPHTIKCDKPEAHYYKPKHKKVALTWCCANGHTFTFGDEDWHYEECQYIMDNGAPVPRYCDWEDADGEPCMDSSSLIWED